MTSKYFILAFFILFLFCLSCCNRDSVPPPKGEPSRYYLRDDDELSLEPRPKPDPDDHMCIIAYIYPSQITTSNTSKSWRTFLTRDIGDSKYGYDLIVRSDSDACLRIEFILDHEGTESVIATTDIDFPGTPSEGAVELKAWIGDTPPLLGENPQSGKGDTLIFRIEHISGNDPIEIYYDGAVGYVGNTNIKIALI